MSTPALALPLTRGLHRQRRRRHALSRTHLQWHDVPVAASGVLDTPPRRGLPRWLVVVLAGTVVALHAAGTWYVNRISLASDAKPRVAKLAVEFVQPPKPKAVEPPPPPPPPKPRQDRAPPPIQTSQVVASEAPIAAPVETVAAVAPAEPAPPAPPEPVKPAFGGIGYKNNPPPDYPAQAVRQGWQGTVLLRVRVLQNGAVESVEVVKSSGKKVLDDAAIHTVQGWVFAPSTRGSTPIDGFATVPIEFKLDS